MRDAMENIMATADQTIITLAVFLYPSNIKHYS